jgi:hypothetical protein
MVEGFQTTFKASGTPGYDISPSCCLLRNSAEFQVGSLQNNIVPVQLLVAMRLIIHAEYLKDNAFG